MRSCQGADIALPLLWMSIGPRAFPSEVDTGSPRDSAGRSALRLERLESSLCGPGTDCTVSLRRTPVKMAS